MGEVPWRGDVWGCVVMVLSTASAHLNDRDRWGQITIGKAPFQSELLFKKDAAPQYSPKITYMIFEL